MTINKKLALSVGTIASIATPIAAAVSCAEIHYLDADDKDSAVIIGGANGHDDKGFMQGAYDGLQDSIKDKSNNLNIYGEVKAMNDGPQEADKAIKAATTAGAYSMWGIGFQFAFLNDYASMSKYKDRQFVALDATVVDSHWAPVSGFLSPNKNMTTVAYKAEQSSFLMGVGTGMYLTKHFDEYSNNGLRAAIYGGSPFGAVQAMMDGYYNGIAWFNSHLAKDDAHKVQIIGRSGKDDYYVGGFSPTERGLSKAQEFIAEDVDIMFPVAGGQVSQAVTAIKTSNKKNIKLVGVDSDQAKVYGGVQGKMFIGSSLKDTRQTARLISKTLFKKGYNAATDAGVLDSATGLKMGENNFVGLEHGYVSITGRTLQNAHSIYEGQYTDFYLGDETDFVNGTPQTLAKQKAAFEAMFKPASAADYPNMTTTVSSDDTALGFKASSGYRNAFEYLWDENGAPMKAAKSATINKVGAYPWKPYPNGLTTPENTKVDPTP